MKKRRFNHLKPLNSSAWMFGPHRVESEDQQNDQNNVAELYSSAYSESSGIQKIIPSDYDVSINFSMFKCMHICLAAHVKVHC